MQTSLLWESRSKHSRSPGFSIVKCDSEDFVYMQRIIIVWKAIQYSALSGFSRNSSFISRCIPPGIRYQQAQLPHSRYRRSTWTGRKHAIFKLCSSNLEQDVGRLLRLGLRRPFRGLFRGPLHARRLHPAFALPSPLGPCGLVSLLL